MIWNAAAAAYVITIALLLILAVTAYVSG